MTYNLKVLGKFIDVDWKLIGIQVQLNSTVTANFQRRQGVARYL